MNLNNKEYWLIDFVRIAWKVSPVLVLLRIIDKVIIALLPTFQIMVTAVFIDTAIRIFGGQSGRGNIIPPLTGLLLLISYQYAVFALTGLATEKINLKLSESFRTAVTAKCARLEYRHIENNETWNLIERVVKDPTGRLGGGFDSLLRMTEMVIRVTAIMLVLMLQVWWAALAILAFSLPLFWLAVKTGRENYEASKEAAQYTRQAGYLESVLTGRESVEERTLFSYSEEVGRRWSERYMKAYGIYYKAELRRFIKMKSASLITVLISVLVAGVLIVPLSSGTISVGMFMGFVTATFGLAMMMSWDLTRITGELADNREYLRELTVFCGLSETADATGLPAKGMTVPRCIEFCNVSFNYPDTDLKILKSLSLTMYTGKHYAFVGVNGAGKTTLTKLLTGLYDNYTGDILIDGKNIREFTQTELKSLFSLVYQDFARYQISLFDSIGVGNAFRASRETVSEAVSILELGGTVAGLPEGMETPLGKIQENGVDLSGGEWQRVAIARSLVNPAPIHILDEPAAALDPVAESRLYELFARISQGKSAIFITHRLGATRLADEIFVIDDGHVAEQGTHEELMDKAGIYAEMFEAQRGWYV